MMARFTATQGRYLSYISAYTNRHGQAPAEWEIAAALCVSPPSVNQMVKVLERRGLIARQPGVARSVRVLVPQEEIPPWHGRNIPNQALVATLRHATDPGPESAVPAPPRRLYVLHVFLVGGPTGPKFANKEISRVIEIRGDQTLEQLHQAIFQAYDRWDHHGYEFQFGRRPYDPKGPNYGRHGVTPERPDSRDARTITLDELRLRRGRVFGYWFDFGDDWYHQVQVDKIDTAIPSVTYPRVTRRVSKSPPQYSED